MVEGGLVWLLVLYGRENQARGVGSEAHSPRKGGCTRNELRSVSYTPLSRINT